MWSGKAQSPTAALLPYPNHVTCRNGKPFQMEERTVEIYIGDEELTFEAAYLQQLLQERKVTGTLTANPKADIQLHLRPEEGRQEHYRLEADAHGIRIEGTTPRAVFYGVVTLNQILLGDGCATAQGRINPILIEDAPRFAYRALMVDPARHFLPLADLKFFIDQMALFKYNTLQLHLTDDQGWRMESKAFPQLASEQYYTQEGLRELVAYAAQRHIEIVPELDIPGHTVAILSAFPELGCTVSDTIPKTVGQTVNLMLCAGVDKVYSLYETLFKELATVFPSPHVHLGGDESVIDRNWAQCARCRQLMKQYGYSEARQLMSPFFDRILKSLRLAGKSPILWCELDAIYPPANEYLFPYPADVTLVTWRSGLTPKCIELTAQQGHPLIMAPGEYTYFDYPQLTGDLPEFNNWGMPVTTLAQAYRFDPGYGLPAPQQQHILGVMGTLWGEAMPDINRVTYMAFPRALALAEAGWTEMSQRDWTSFKKRLYPNLYNLMKHGVSVRVPFEIVERKPS